MRDDARPCDPVFVGGLSWDVVARRLAGGAFAILPVGAGAKQHGLHLPMGADAILAEWLATRLANELPGLVWPTLTYGHYPAFAAYAGSCALSAALFEAVVRELATALLGYGTPGVVILDTGISTIAPIDRAVAACGRRVMHLKVYEGSRYHEAAGRATVGHADRLETSCLLALSPNLVHMERAAAGPLATDPGPLQHDDQAAANYSASGSVGDPAGATAAEGAALLAAMLEDMTEAVREWRVAPPVVDRAFSEK